MQTRNSARLLGAAIAAIFAVGAANAGAGPNLVANGGFETGDFTGWTTFGSANDLLHNIGVDDHMPQSGTYGAWFGPEKPAGISQALATAAGQSYLVSFWTASEADILGNTIPNSAQFGWGNTTPWSVTNANVSGYVQHSFNLTASSASTQLTFTFTNIPGFWDLDNVSVTAVPEPSSWAMALAGIAVVAMGAKTARRRGA